MITSINVDYQSDYNKGWEQSRRGASLDTLDSQGASHAQYDGFMDYATDRGKWAWAIAILRAGGDKAEAETLREGWMDMRFDRMEIREAIAFMDSL